MIKIGSVFFQPSDTMHGPIIFSIIWNGYMYFETKNLQLGFSLKTKQIFIKIKQQP
jgi:hypothetical protein